MAKKIDLTVYNIIVVALMTAMRRGEIFNLEWSEIDFTNNRILLSKDKTKSKKARFIPVIPSLKEHLLKIKNSGFSNTKYVFPEKTSSGSIFETIWYKILKQLPSFSRLSDGTKLRFHDLRSCTSQLLLDQGLDLNDIADLLGHSDTVVTRRYAMFARPDLHKKVKVLDNIIDLNKIKTG